MVEKKSTPGVTDKEEAGTFLRLIFELFFSSSSTLAGCAPWASSGSTCIFWPRQRRAPAASGKSFDLPVHLPRKQTLPINDIPTTFILPLCRYFQLLIAVIAIPYLAFVLWITIGPLLPFGSMKSLYAVGGARRIRHARL